jgi:hypothetical protein
MGSHAISQHRSKRSLCMKAALQGTTMKRSRRQYRHGSGMAATSSASSERSRANWRHTRRRPQPSIGARCHSPP